MWICRAVKALLPLALVALALCGCANGVNEDGYVNVIGGKVYYKMIDHGGGGTPLIVVHGGPGVPHQYLQSLAELANDRPVIFYDQLGCGKSDRPQGDQFWIPRRFAREIGAIRDELGINECYILSDSWGAIPATEYLLTMPKEVRGVVLSSPILSGPRFIADAQGLTDQLPSGARDAIRRHEQNGTTDSSEYQRAFKEFYKRHVYRRWSEPAELKDALAEIGPDVYRVMHGTNHIDVNGTLRNYDRTADLWQIKQPTLIICGRYDEVPPETAAHYNGKLSNSTMKIFQRSSHMPIFEEHDAYIETVRKYLDECERRYAAANEKSPSLKAKAPHPNPLPEYGARE
ncbi:MAG: proline iminopeptidase-family hydrolase [Anaerolineae bacterium]|nr:proline iminopeptidase-family hydrolase [Phycisphaerae bacterium]